MNNNIEFDLKIATDGKEGSKIHTGWVLILVH